MTSIASNSIRRSCRLLGKKVVPQKDDAVKKLTDNNNNIPPIKKLKNELESNKHDIDNPIANTATKNHDVFTAPFTLTNKLTRSSPTPDGYLEVDLEELDLERTLLGGQSFRWTKEISSDGYLIFTGILLDNVLKLWRISDSKIAFKKVNKDFGKISSNIREILTDYFQLRYNLKQLYKEWSDRDEHFAKCCQHYKGFRILRQDPVENVFSFICATNNNIKRISQMIEKLCKRYGDILDNRHDEPSQSIYDSYHSFPPVERLAEEDVFQCLRHELGFGYRAKFIAETAKELLRLSQQVNSSKLANLTSKIKIESAAELNLETDCTPRDYLMSLRKLPYKETCRQLMRLPGIGRKVADCICLMSMDHLSSVPIDCHIYQIVCRNYMPNLRQERKSLTDSVHDLIGEHFKSLHGDLAGWSTSVLFIGELKHLKPTEGPKASEKEEVEEEKEDQDQDKKAKVCKQSAISRKKLKSD